MAEPRLRWGILGSAGIALKRVIPALQASPEHNVVVAIASRDAARARPTAEALGIPRWYAAYADLLADPGIDAVYIPLPNSLHAEWTIRAAEAGKHVVCEKPMAPTVAECREMIAACRRHGVRFMEGLMWRFHPQHARVRELIAKGLIGAPAIVRASFCVRMLRPAEDIRFNPELGGGALLDVGVYAIDAVRWLIGAEPVTVRGTARVDERGLDVAAAAALGFPGGELAVVTTSFVAAGSGTYEVIGPQGRIVVEQAFSQAADRPARVSWDVDGRHSAEVLPAVDQHRLMFDAFARALLRGEPPPLADDAGIGNIAVIEAIRGMR